MADVPFKKGDRVLIAAEVTDGDGRTVKVECTDCLDKTWILYILNGNVIADTRPKPLKTIFETVVEAHKGRLLTDGTGLRVEVLTDEWRLANTEFTREVMERFTRCQAARLYTETK